MPQMGPLPWSSLCLSVIVLMLSWASLLYFFFAEEKTGGVVAACAALGLVCAC